jgi:hypothetical protein
MRSPKLKGRRESRLVEIAKYLTIGRDAAAPKRNPPGKIPGGSLSFCDGDARFKPSSPPSLPLP